MNLTRTYWNETKYENLMEKWDAEKDARDEANWLRSLKNSLKEENILDVIRRLYTASFECYEIPENDPIKNQLLELAYTNEEIWNSLMHYAYSISDKPLMNSLNNWLKKHNGIFPN